VTVANFYEGLETTNVNIPWEQDVSVLLVVFHKLIFVHPITPEVPVTFS